VLCLLRACDRLAVETILCLYRCEQSLSERIPLFLRDININNINNVNNDNNGNAKNTNNAKNSNTKNIDNDAQIDYHSMNSDSAFLLLDLNNIKIYCVDGTIEESHVIHGIVFEAEVLIFSPLFYEVYHFLFNTFFLDLVGEFYITATSNSSCPRFTPVSSCKGNIIHLIDDKQLQPNQIKCVN
jgi:hypothetical protein